MSVGSLFQEVVEETQSLLDRYGLPMDALLLRERGADFDTVLKVLLHAFQETSDDAFFGNFYRLTQRLLKGRVEKLLGDEEVSADSEEIVTQVYEAALDRLSGAGVPGTAGGGMGFGSLSPGMGIGGPIAGFGISAFGSCSPAAAGSWGDLRILDFLYTAAAGLVRGRRGSGEDPALFPVRLEEERREDLLRARIHETISGGELSLDDRERRILFEYYKKNGEGIEKIAAAMELSSDTIREVLFKASKEVLKLLELGAVSPAEGEDAS